MSDGIESFMEQFRALGERLIRVETLCTLFTQPIKALNIDIDWRLLQRFMDEKADDPAAAAWDYSGGKRDYTCVYVHQGTGMRVDFSSTANDQDKLRLAILSIAAVEGMMPLRLLQEIQPDCVGVVDALAEAGRDPGT